MNFSRISDRKKLENKDLFGIIIVPTSLLHNWKEEFYKFSDIKPILVEGNAETRKELIEKKVMDSNNVLLKNGEKEIKEISHLKIENQTVTLKRILDS